MMFLDDSLSVLARTCSRAHAVHGRRDTMKTALRALAGVLAGLLVSFILVVAVELISDVVHPLPKDFGGTKEEMCQHVERYPQWVLAMVVPLWAAAAFAGTWTAQKVGNL